MSILPDSQRFASIEGNPTSEENVVLAAIIASMSNGADIDTQHAQDGIDETESDLNAKEEFGDDTPSSEGLEEHRRCPICQQRFDSRFVLTEQRRITTSKDSTLCFDTEHDRIYLHSTE